MNKSELKEHGIGGTLFHHAKNLERFLGISRLYLKFEAGNPTGTMKDRAAYAVLSHAYEEGHSSIAVASCGNYGASIVYLSKLFEITPHVYIPEGYEAPRIKEILHRGGVIHRTQGTYEDAVDTSSREVEENGWYNGNPGIPDNTRVSLDAYARIASEIVDYLEYAPDVVSVPVSNGTCLAGVHHGFKKLHRRGTTSRVPVMVAAGTSGGNPVIKSFNAGKRKITELKPSEITETPINEPLVSWRSLDGQSALDALHETQGYAAYVQDEVMQAFSQLLDREEGLSVLPASASALSALSEYVKAKATPRMNAFVAVLTSRRY
ncbi:MAG: pyridoxal-phosphate dependent enzyme [Candidatus Bathyarchaeota archaeon]|nr:pyridoxal-phosphate dependent enzyme [Candidatus Bathyarchaeota archaeon]